MVEEKTKTYFTRTGNALFYGGFALMLGAAGNFLYGNRDLNGSNIEILRPYDSAQISLSQLERKKSDLEIGLLMPFDLGAPGGGMFREGWPDDIQKLEAVKYAISETKVELEKLEDVPAISREIRNRKDSENKGNQSTLYSVLMLVPAVLSMCASSDKKYMKEKVESKV